MADAHGHLGHQMVVVVEHQTKQGPLLGRCQEPEDAGQAIAQSEKPVVRPTRAHVADEVAAAIFQPVLQPVRDECGLNVEFVQVLHVSVLLRGASSQHLDGLAGDPVMLQQIGTQIMDPPAGEGDSLAEEPAGAGVVFLGQLHEMNTTLQAAVQQHLDF